MNQVSINMYIEIQSETNSRENWDCNIAYKSVHDTGGSPP